MKKSHKLTAAAAAVTLLASTAAQAGPYTDDLSKCLVRSTSEQQKAVLVEWVFAIAALHPSVKPLSSVSDAKRTDLNKSVADLFTTLLTASCRQETQDAVKYEGAAAIQTSFALLGQVAMTDLFSNPDVAQGLGAFSQYLDKSKFDSVFQTAPAAAPVPNPGH